MLLWPWQLLLILVAPAMGSFLGMLVERLPRGRSVLERSTCADCGAPLRPADLVPLLSALALRGRCRACGAAIPGHLVRIEIAALAVGLLVAFTTESVADMFVLAGYLWCLVALLYSDLLYFRLPDALTAALLVLGLALAALDPGRGWLEGLLTAAGAGVAFLALRIGYRTLRGREGLGLGDVKLAAGIGAGLGWALFPVATLLAALLGLSAASFEAAREGGLPRAATRLPLGTYLCAATALIWFWKQLDLALPGQF